MALSWKTRAARTDATSPPSTTRLFASTTKKELEFLAKQQNMTTKDIANQVKAIVQSLMMELNNPDLGTQVTATVMAYLDNPKSIKVVAKPASRVPFTLLAASGMSNLNDFPKTIDLKVTANQN